MGTTEQYFVVKRPKNAGNGSLRVIEKMDSLLISKAPIVPLYYDQSIRFTQKNVSGLGSNPINLLTLKYVKKTPAN